jgi:energy-coupling factor transporter ATP-binding protein EcfA2
LSFQAVKREVVAIAGVLAMRPKVWFKMNRQQGLIQKDANRFLMNQRLPPTTGSTVFAGLTQHGRYCPFCRRCAGVSDGKLFAYGSVDDVFSKTLELNRIWALRYRRYQAFL